MDAVHPPGSDEAEIMKFLHEMVFDPILASPNASDALKQGVRLTIMRMNDARCAGDGEYYWSAVGGTERSLDFSAEMKARDSSGSRIRRFCTNFRSVFPSTTSNGRNRRNQMPTELTEQVAYWFFRLNGCFTFVNFVVHPDGPGGQPHRR